MHPGVNGLWAQALALGYRVAVRPSRRDPFTAHRLVHVLGEAGFRAADAIYLPTDYAGAEEMILRADLSVVYGGADAVAKYARDPSVLTNGPGRTKILITAEQDWRDHLELIVDSVAALAGMGCVNATAVLYEGDPAPLAGAIAERLARMAPGPNTSEQAVLPTMTLDAAQTLAGRLAAKASGADEVLGAGQVVAPVGDGYAALRPAVHVLQHPDMAKLNTELPFPCVWVSPWSRDDGVAPLRNSLVLNVLTTDERLVDDFLADPTITNVYLGPVPTHYSAPHVPHEGFLADFLMRNKGFIASR